MLLYGLPAELYKVLCTARVGVLEVYGHWLSLYTSGVLIDCTSGDTSGVLIEPSKQPASRAGRPPPYRRTEGAKPAAAHHAARVLTYS